MSNSVCSSSSMYYTYQAGDEVVVVGRHHAHLLGLLQHRVDLLSGAVQDDVDLARLLHVLQQGPIIVCKTHPLQINLVVNLCSQKRACVLIGIKWEHPLEGHEKPRAE